jgi:predicted porin
MFKRALMVAAVAAAVSAPTFAEVSISGSAEMGFMVVDPKNGDATQEFDRAFLLNFDGSDKLDSGSKFIWRVSQKVTSIEGTNWGTREAYAGLTGDWGTFKYGKQFLNSYLTLDWPYGINGNWQLAERTWGPKGHAGKLTALIYGNTSVNYTSPDFGGFSFGVQHGWDVNKATQTGKVGDSNVTDLSANFSFGGVNLNAGYLFGNDVTAKGSKENQYFIGANTSFGDLGVRAVYNAQSTKSAKGVTKDSQDWLLGANYSLGKGTIKASIHQFDGDDFGSAGRISALAYHHGLSKNTEGYARIQNRNKNAGDMNVFLVGMWHGF